MQDWFGYVILFLAFCVAPIFILAVIVGAIWMIKRSNQTNKPAPAQPTKMTTTSPMKTNNPPAPKKTILTAATKTAPRSAAQPATIQTTVAAGSTSRAASTPGKSPAVPLGGYTPIYLNFSNKPRAILDNMHALTAQAEKSNTTRSRWKLGPRLLFLVGLGMIVLEFLLWVLGYTPTCVFLVGGIALWIVAIFLSVGLRRAEVKAFPPRFNEFAQVVDTLRDDLRPDTGLIGNLDLTGAKQTSKVARSAKDSQNRTTQYFRDQWLNLKAKMYDGNILRVSAIQRVKERAAYTKRSRISGKMKMKPAKLKGSYQELKVRIAVNPDVYKIVPNDEIKPAAQIGEYTINAVDTEGGIVTVLASTPKEDVSAQSILGVLKFAYGLLQTNKA